MDIKLFEQFKHKHEVFNHVLKEIVKKDLIANFEYYSHTDVTVVHLTYPCLACKKDMHFIYDYDKGLIKFDDDSLIGIEFNVNLIGFNLVIKLDPSYHVLFNDGNYDTYIQAKLNLLENLNQVLGHIDPSPVTNHITLLEQIDVMTKKVIETSVENTCLISLNYEKLRELYKALKKEYKDNFSITIVNI